MSTLVGVEKVRTRRRAAASLPSVREVCLLGMPRPGPGKAKAADWTPGAQVVLSGRVYRVRAARPRADQDGGRRYVHLTPDAAETG